MKHLFMIVGLFSLATGLTGCRNDVTAIRHFATYEGVYSVQKTSSLSKCNLAGKTVRVGVTLNAAQDKINEVTITDAVTKDAYETWGLQQAKFEVDGRSGMISGGDVDLFSFTKEKSRVKLDGRGASKSSSYKDFGVVMFIFPFATSKTSRDSLRVHSQKQLRYRSRSTDREVLLLPASNSAGSSDCIFTRI